MSKPLIKVIVLESERDAATAIPAECSDSENHQHHVFCRSPDESLRAFKARVVGRVAALSRNHVLATISYFVGASQGPHGADGRDALLAELTQLLHRNSDLAVDITASADVDLIELLAPLQSVAPPGATINVRRTGKGLAKTQPRIPEALCAADATSAFAEARSSSTSYAGAHYGA